MKFLREIVVVAALLAGASAQAAPKNIDDCEKIKEPMAYNECLASFGPARGTCGRGAVLRPGQRGRAARGGEGSKARAPTARRRGAWQRRMAMRGANGRVRMEFTPRHR